MKLLFPLLLTAVLLAAGCASYKLGSDASLPFKSVYVPPAQNLSYAPQAQSPLTNQLVELLMQEPNLVVARMDHADASLEVTIADYERIISATRSDDTVLAQAYQVRMTALVSLRDNRTGTYYFKDRIVDATQQVFTDGGLQISEYEAMVVLTRSLAQRIRNAVVSVW